MPLQALKVISFSKLCTFEWVNPIHHRQQSCFVTRQPLMESDLKRMITFEQVVCSHKVFCQEREALHMERKKKMARVHLENYNYKEITCWHKECNSGVLRWELEMHELNSNTCPVHFSYCNFSVPTEWQEGHDAYCKEAPVMCSFKCSANPISQYVNNSINDDDGNNNNNNNVFIKKNIR